MLLTLGNGRISRKVKMEWCRHLNNIERGGLRESLRMSPCFGTRVLESCWDGKFMPPAVDLNLKELRLRREL